VVHRKTDFKTKLAAFGAFHQPSTGSAEKNSCLGTQSYRIFAQRNPGDAVAAEVVTVIKVARQKIRFPENLARKKLSLILSSLVSRLARHARSFVRFAEASLQQFTKALREKASQSLWPLMLLVVPVHFGHFTGLSQTEQLVK